MISMKKVSSFVLALVAALLMVAGTAQAQTWNNTNPGNWQSANWGIPSTWPGQLANNSAAIINPNAALTMNNSAPANPIGDLNIQNLAGVFTVTLNGTGTLTVNGDLTVDNNLVIGTGFRLVVKGALKGSAQIFVATGATLRLENTAATAIQGTLTISAAAPSVSTGTIDFGAGYNAGVFPTSLFSGNTAVNSITVNSNMSVPGTFTMTSGPLTLNGNLTVNPLGNLQLQQRNVNSLQGSSLLGAQPGGQITFGVPGTSLFNNGVIPGSSIASPFFGQLNVTTGTLAGNLTLGANGVLNLASGNVSNPLTILAGSTLTVNNTSPNAINQGAPRGFIAINAGGTLAFGVGANASILPIQVVTNANGTIQTAGPMTLNLPGVGSVITPFPTTSFTSVLNLGGDLTLASAGTIRLAALGSNTIIGTGKIQAASPASIIRVDPGFNNGILNGSNFGCPISATFQIATGANFDVQNTLCLGGPVQIGGLLTVTSNSELRLSNNSANSISGAGGLSSTVGIVSLNNTGVVRLSSGFNAGVLPIPRVPFLVSTGATAFKGRLIVESNQILARPLTFDVGSILDLNGGNLTVSGATVLVLNNQGAGSITGTGFLQGTEFAPPGVPVPGQIALGPTFSNGILNTARFANPFYGFLNVSTATALTMQGNLVLGSPFGKTSLFLGPTQLTIAAGSSLTLNGVTTATVVTDATLPGFIQGIDCTSKLILGPQFNNGTIASQGVLASPFNGGLVIQGRGALTNPMQVTRASLTIGQTGCLTLQDDIALAPGANLTLNNQSASSLNGTGRIGGPILSLLSGGTLAAFGPSTITLGTGFNNGVVNAANFTSPLNSGLVLPISPLNLNGSLTMGSSGATLFTQAPGTLTILSASGITFTTNANAIWGSGRIAGTDLTSQVNLGNGGGFNSGWSGISTTGPLGTGATGINAQQFVSPFVGTMNIAPPPANTNRPVYITNGTFTFAPNSVLNLLGPVVVTSANNSSVVLGMTGLNSLTGTTLGTVTGASVNVPIILGPGFNGGQIDGRRFGPTTPQSVPFVGSLQLPSSGSFRLTASLTTATATVLAADGNVTAGEIQLNGSNLTIDDAIQLVVSMNATTGAPRLTTLTGTIQGATNLSEVILPLITTGNPAVTAATFASPFNGRLTIGRNNPLNSAIPIAPNFIAYSLPNVPAGATLTIGASGSANGVLNVATSAVFVVQDGANLVLNNTSSTGASLPGGGNISGAGPNASITLGPGALGATIPGAVFTNPFIGNLVTSPGPEMTLTQPGITMGTGLADDAKFTAGGPVAIGANANFVFNNTTISRLIAAGAGSIRAADPTTSRFTFGAGANGGTVPGCVFSNPWTGTMITSGAMNLECRLVLGASNSFNGILSLGGTLSVTAGTVGITPYGANLVINNRNPDFIVLPGLQTITVAGTATGGDVLNGRLTIGPGALSTTANVAIIPNFRLTGNSLTGTLASSTGTAQITSGSVILAAPGGSLRIAGNTGNTAVPFSTSNVISLGGSATLVTMNTDANALNGNGVIQGTSTRSQVYFGATANASTIPGNLFGQHFTGTFYTNGAMNLSGNLRLAPQYSFATSTGASMQLGGTLTVLAGARLDVWNTLAAPGNAFPAPGSGAAGILGGTNGGNVAVPGFINPATVVLGPGFNAGVIDQGATPLLTPVFNGMLITSTGTTTVSNGPLTFGTLGTDGFNTTTGTLQIGGNFLAGAAVALRFNNTSYRASNFGTADQFNGDASAFTHSVTPGAGTFTVNAATANSSITLANGFNGSYFPTTFFGATQSLTLNTCSGTANFQVIGNGIPNGQLNILGPTVAGTVRTLTMIPAGTNLRVNGTLQFGNAAGISAAGRFVIATSSTLSALSAVNIDATNFGTIAAAAPSSIYDAAGPATVDTFYPALGLAGGFTGILRVSGNIVISGVTETLAASGQLSLCNNAMLSLANVATSGLNLNNTGTNSLNGTGLILGTSATNSVLNLGAGFNGGQIPGGYFGSSANPFNGTMRLAGNTPANTGAGSLSVVTAPLFIGATGLFDFTAGSANKLTLTQPASVLGTVSNSGSTQYFVTAPGALTLGNVGNVTFPVGPSSTVFAPINLTNNATPASFSVVAAGSVTQAVPFATGSAVLRQSIVNQQWNVSQLTGVTPGFAVTVTPLWLPGQEAGGFNRSLAVTNAFTTTSGTISSGAGAAASDPTFAGYFRSGVTVTQTATNNLNNTPILVSSQPSPAVLAFTPPAQSSGATLTITGNRFAPGASVSLGGVNVPAASVTLVSGGSSGIDTLRVVVPSNAASGNVVVTQTGGTSTAASQFTFLGTPLQQAVIRTVTPSPIPAGLGDVEITIDGAAFGVLTPRVVAAGSGITSTITPSSNTTTRIVATIPGNVVRNIGSVVFTVTSLDRLPVSTTVTVSTPPALALTSLSPSTTTGNLRAFTISVNGNNFSAQSLFSLGTTTLRVLSVTRNSDGTLTARVEAPVGVLSGNVTVLNLNGQTASLPFVVNSLPRPLVNGVSPNVLPPGSPAATIAITGRYFIPGAVVSFNGTPLTGVQLTGDSLITVTIPAGLLANPDLAVLTVTNPDGQSIGYRLPITVAAPGAIEIRSFTPTTTTASASAFSILIDGSGFAGTPTVFLGGVQLTVVGATSATQLRVNVPATANVAGTYQLQVVNPSGVMAQRSYTIEVNTTGLNPQTAPAITRVTPTVANAGVTTNITIEGVNFVAGSVVRLGGTQLAIVSLSADGTRIVATVPGTVAAGAYVLSVTVPDGRAATQPFPLAVGVSAEPLAGIRVYPNPVVESVSVEANLERAAKVVITVTNSLGQRVMVVEQNAAAGFFSRSLNINSLPTGAYMVEITDGARRSVEKIIKN